MLLQSAQNSWESLRDYAWIIAGILLLVATVLSIGIFASLIRYGARLLHSDFATRRRALESFSPHRAE